MPANEDDMTPVTKAELREELKPIREALARMATKADLENMATKADLDALKIATKADLDELKIAAKTDLDERTNVLLAFIEKIIAETRSKLSAELAQHANMLLGRIADMFKVSQEANASNSELAAVDDKYSDLPARVSKLELAVFPPKRQRRR